MGKQKSINDKHYKIGKQKLFEAGKTRCEMCFTDSWLSQAHRHTRDWYRSQPELLSDINQILTLCVPCHQKIEGLTKVTEELFKRLRP